MFVLFSGCCVDNQSHDHIQACGPLLTCPPWSCSSNTFSVSNTRPDCPTAWPHSSIKHPHLQFHKGQNNAKEIQRDRHNLSAVLWIHTYLILQFTNVVILFGRFVTHCSLKLHPFSFFFLFVSVVFLFFYAFLDLYISLLSMLFLLYSGFPPLILILGARLISQMFLLVAAESRLQPPVLSVRPSRWLVGVLSGRLAKLDKKHEMIWASRAPAGLLPLLLNTCSWLWC